MKNNTDALSMQKKSTWYNNHKFPLIPQLEIKQANTYNTKGFSFSWLFFKLWSIDAPCFEFSIVCDTHWGIGLIGLLPFFRWAICIPCPTSLEIWVHKNLSRSRNIKY